MRTVYFTLFESVMRYGITGWGGTSAGNLEMVLGIQKDAVRCLARKEKWVRVGDHWEPPSCRPLFKDLGIPTVHACYIMESIGYFLKHGEQLSVGEASAYCTRNANDFRLPKLRLKKTEQSVMYAGASYFNKLPADLKQQRGSRGFARGLRSFLIEKAVYSLAEAWHVPSV